MRLASADKKYLLYILRHFRKCVILVLVMKMAQDLHQKNFDQYFASFEALESDIESRIGCSVMDASLSVTTQTAIAIIYLVWSGISRKAIPLIRKAYLKNGSQIYDPISKKNRTVPVNAMRFLAAYAELPIYMGLPGKTPYLIRGKLSMQMSYVNITNAICGFNSRFGFGRSPYVLTAIYESGVFCRAAKQVAKGTILPIYHQNYPLTDAGMGMYELIFDRKFPSIDVLTRYLKRYNAYCVYCLRHPRM